MKRLPILSTFLTTMLCGFYAQGEGVQELVPAPACGGAALAGEGAAVVTIAIYQELPSGTTAQGKRPPGRPRPGDAANAAPPGDYVHFPSVGVKIRQPKGFEKADSFDGFGQPETKSSVMAVSLPAPFPKIAGAFTAEPMKAQGWTFRSRQDVKIDDQAGVLVHFEQMAGDEVFLKWALAFGDDRKTIMVTAAIPKTRERELSDLLKSVVLSTRPDGAPALAPGSDLPFTIMASQKLKLATGINRTLTYTKVNASPAKSPKDPLFIAAPSLGKVELGDRREFAERRLLGTAQTKRLQVKSTDAITVDKLGGYESLAEAEDAKSRTPLSVYQVILFDGESYILMQGLVGSELRDEFLPEFKAMARSLKRKQP